MSEIANYINNQFKAFESQETIADLQDFFTEVNYTHFSVVEEGVYIGCVAADDIETFDSDKKIADYKYALEGFFVRESMIWLDVLEVFAKNQTNLVPVLDEKNSYLGYYEMEDVMRFFRETPFLKEEGGILIVKKNRHDYSMSQVAQIVESNNGSILGIIATELDNENIEVTIKIALGSMNEIIQTFRRYNYEIVSDHQDDTYINSLKERSDYLEKYLNI